MKNQKTIKGLSIEYNGKTIDNITELVISTWDKLPVNFSYFENENTRVNVNCALKDIKINIEQWGKDMKNQKRNFIDEMVDIFGYDYVIGYCLCSEYDIKKKAGKEEDEEKARGLLKVAKRYSAKAEQLTRERIANGL